MLIRHLRLKGIVPYAKAANLQQDLVTKFLAHKASPTTTSAPTPTIITAQFSPVYTCGRREVGTVSEEQQTFLKDNGNAEFYEALRGGQTTFHGPGQLVAYPIIDLKTHGLSPRNYVCLLEKTLIKTCARYGIKAMTTENPGVWTTPDDKISALGVHLRRNITSHGIGLNVNTDLKWFSRIVACGLEGKRTTSFENEGVQGQSVDEVADAFVRQLAGSLEGIDDIVQVLTIGDSVITVETHRRETESIEPPVARQRKKSFGLRRVNTAPAAAHPIPLHGSITTIESIHKGRAWSYPLSWKDLNLVRRIRRSADRKEARRGKASCDLTSVHGSSDGIDEHDIASSSLPVMSVACENSPSHTSRPIDELDISPRTSVCLNAGSNVSGERGNHRNSSSAEQVNRKDSHVHDAAQTKGKATADLKACTRKLSSDERSSGNLTFLLHPIDWIRQYHASVSSNPDSGSSSSSSSSPSSPTIRPSQPARRIEEIRVTHTQPAKPRPSLACTREEMYMDVPLNLPPGFEVPTVGQAGPADWLHRGWEDHYRRSAEASRRACHPLAAARYLPTRGRTRHQIQAYDTLSLVILQLGGRVKVFETLDVQEVLKAIIKKGDVQVVKELVSPLLLSASAPFRECSSRMRHE
ncbi:lipoyltransferase [Aureobasidium sp. EXF-8845]|nr:lipoyltransferase [Aureobasidium sp. EXF-8845]KAI4858025.1 lipoyltransferase [Aureobasidium sp. EXF-8846]